MHSHDALGETASRARATHKIISYRPSTKPSVPAAAARVRAGQQDPHSPGRRHDGSCGTAGKGRFQVGIDERDNGCIAHASTITAASGVGNRRTRGGGRQPQSSGDRPTRATCSARRRSPIVQSRIRIGARIPSRGPTIATKAAAARPASNLRPSGRRAVTTPASRAVREANKFLHTTGTTGAGRQP